MRLFTHGLAAIAVVLALPANGQSVDDVLKAGDRKIKLAQASQDRIDEIVDTTRNLVDEYNQVSREIDGLEVYNALMERQVADQETEMARLAASIDEVTVIERQIMPLMLRMIDSLDRFVSLDTPFLIDERQARVSRLRELMERSDVTVAEKFRNVLEAYQVENDYGRTIESYKGELEISGGLREVDFLRIGRVALLYQTVDGAFTGAWNKESQGFDLLDAGSARSQVRQGLRIANQEVAPDLVLLPVPAPEDAS